MWFRHPTFEQLFSDIWDAGRKELIYYFYILPKALRDWSKHVFGNLAQRKAKCRARLNGIQRYLSIWELEYLEKLEIVNEFNELLI